MREIGKREEEGLGRDISLHENITYIVYITVWLREKTHPDPVLHVLVVVTSQLVHYNPLRKLHLRTWTHTV